MFYLIMTWIYCEVMLLLFCSLLRLFSKHEVKSTTTVYEQESCAIAKMTAQCALYMGALKIFGTP